MAARARVTGVTLIELMVVLAVVAIAALLAGPSFSDSLKRARLKEKVGAVVEVLEFAKSEGLKRSSVVTAITPAVGSAGWKVSTGIWQGATLVEAKSAEQGTSDVALRAPTSASSAALNFRGIVSGHVSRAACADTDPCIELATRDGTYRARVGITTVGQVVVCSKGTPIRGYAAC